MNIYIISQRPAEPYPYIIPCVPTFIIVAPDEADAIKQARQIVDSYANDPDSRFDGMSESSLRQMKEDWNGVVHSALLGIADQSLSRGAVIYTLG